MEIEELFDELEDLSDSGPELDTMSVSSTPKPSLRPFFSSSRSLLAPPHAGKSRTVARCSVELCRFCGTLITELPITFVRLVIVISFLFISNRWFKPRLDSELEHRYSYVVLERLAMTVFKKTLSILVS